MNKFEYEKTYCKKYSLSPINLSNIFSNPVFPFVVNNYQIDIGTVLKLFIFSLTIIATVVSLLQALVN